MNIKTYLPANKLATVAYSGGAGSIPLQGTPMQHAGQQKRSTRPPSTNVNGPMPEFRCVKILQDVARVKAK
jgi:hypothetical protein